MNETLPITLYKNHGKSIGWWSISTETYLKDDQAARVLISHSKTLEGKITRNEYTVQGKNIGRANETTPAEQARLEAISRAKKQLDKGYVETLEAAQAGSASNSLGLAMPMLAHPLDKVKPESIDWNTAFVSRKLDGHRALFKDGQLYSRQGKPINLPHIVEAIKTAGLENFHLDGELYAHGRSLQEIGSLVKKPREESLEIKYHLYDVVSNLSYGERVYQLLIDKPQKHTNSVEMIETFKVSSADEMMQLHEHFLAEGYEGTMLRHGTAGYEDGKRSRNLLKVKNFSDMEAVITGYRAGKPRYHNGEELPQGVWELQTDNGEQFTATMQGDMFEKARLYREAEQHIGRLLTVKFHYLSAAGVPQLPVALRFREDI